MPSPRRAPAPTRAERLAAALAALTPDDLAAMVLPQDVFSIAGPAFSVDLIGSGSTSLSEIEHLLAEASDPTLSEVILELHDRFFDPGTLASYTIGYRALDEVSALDKRRGAIRYGSEVVLFADEPSAAAALARTVERLHAILSTDLYQEVFSIRYVRELGVRGLPDGAVGLVFHVDMPPLERSLEITSVTFRRGPLLAAVIAVRADTHDDGAFLVARARRLDERIEGVLLREIEAERSPLAVLGGEIVTFDQDGLTITGELLLPPGPGPHPAVLFTSGTGPDRRDGWGGGVNARTGEMLRAIADRGFAVLSFDDRGAGATPWGVDDAAEVGFELRLADAAAAYRYLRARSEVDPDRVFLMGHSEGGVTVLALAVQEAPPAGIILMASPGRTIDAIAVDQALYHLGPEADAAARAERIAEVQAEIGAMIDGTVDALPLPEEEKEWLRIDALRIRELMAYDTVALIAALPQDGSVPVIAFQGDKDWQVLAEKDGAALEAILAVHPGGAYALLLDADALLFLEEGVSTPDHYLDTSRDFHPDFLPTLLGWFDEQR